MPLSEGESKKKMGRILSALLIAFVVGFDQITKYFAEKNLADASVSVIPNVFSFDLTYNKGIAWGLLKDQRWVFLSLSTVAIIGIGVLYFYIKKQHPLLRLSLGFILGGGIGNMIDRIFNPKGVVDFIKTDFMDFPYFNVADSFITVGAIMFAVYLIFYDRKQEKPLVFDKPLKEAASEDSEDSEDDDDDITDDGLSN